MKKSKLKKQFRLYDVYRYAITGEMSNVEGILSYDCNKDVSTLTVTFVDFMGVFKNGIQRIYFIKNENDLKQAVSKVNKLLGNCLTPGPRRKN